MIIIPCHFQLFLTNVDCYSQGDLENSLCQLMQTLLGTLRLLTTRKDELTALGDRNSSFFAYNCVKSKI